MVISEFVVKLFALYYIYFKILWKRFLQTWRWFYTLVYGGLLFQQLHVGAHTCFKKIDLCGCVTINQCILKTESYNRLKHVIIKGNCKYSKLIFVTNFFCFIIYMYKYNQAKILLLLCVYKYNQAILEFLSYHVYFYFVFLIYWIFVGQDWTCIM